MGTEPSCSPWAAPAILVKRRAVPREPTIDDLTLQPDSNPLPRVGRFLEGIAGSQWFTSERPPAGGACARNQTQDSFSPLLVLNGQVTPQPNHNP